MFGWKSTALTGIGLVGILMGGAHAQTPSNAPDWAAMLECRISAEKYLNFVLNDFQQSSYKKSIGVKRVRQDNPFLHEYELNKPVSVYGYTTRRVAFTSSGVMALVDERDPAQLAHRLGLDIAYHGGEKILASKVLSKTEPEPFIDDVLVWHVVSQEVSTVSSHPGKTLVGCSYRMETNEK